MTKITLQDAAKDLPAIIARARAGEAIMIVDGHEMLVRLDPVYERKGPRQPGSMKGQLLEPKGLVDPLTDEELRDWLGDPA